jgi:carboxypeptidase Q
MRTQESHNHLFIRLFIRLLTIVLVVSPILSTTARQSDLTAVSQRIRAEAFAHSRIMDYAFYLTEVYGPRLTGSPNFRAAGEWAMRELGSLGLSNIRKELFEDFRYGWANTRFSVVMTAPSFAPLIGAPLAWSTGTQGPVEGEPVRVDLPSQTTASVTQFCEKYRGKLRGKILLLNNALELKLRTSGQSIRWSDSEIADQVAKADLQAKPPAPVPSGQAPQRPNMDEIQRVNNQFKSFLADEGVVAMIGDLGNPRMNDGGAFSVEKALLQGPNSVMPELPPMIVMAAEHYNRVVRLVNKGITVRLRLDVGVNLIDHTPDAFSVIGEIPGGRKKDEIIMVGAHLDSWAGGTGATDNAAGCAVVMEVARILKALGVPLDRTVRFALWGGEEQGIKGSRSYVSKYLMDFKSGTRKPEYDKFSSYYNLDEGTGRVRGVLIGDNVAVRPLVETWLAPVRDLGATAVLTRPGTGSDDASFAQAGLPIFSFLQDPLEYRSRTLHTNMDVYDRLQKDDLMQAAIVLATLVYADANRDVPMPRPSSHR